MAIGHHLLSLRKRGEAEHPIDLLVQRRKRVPSDQPSCLRHEDCIGYLRYGYYVTSTELLALASAIEAGLAGMRRG